MLIVQALGAEVISPAKPDKLRVVPQIWNLNVKGTEKSWSQRSLVSQARSLVSLRLENELVSNKSKVEIQQRKTKKKH